MNFFVQCAIGTLAAIGLICILKIGYDIIFHRTIFHHGKAKLYLYTTGEQAQVEQLLRIAERVRTNYLPGLVVILVNIAKDKQMIRFSSQEPFMQQYMWKRKR